MWLATIEFTRYCIASFIVLVSIFTPGREPLAVYSSAAVWIVMLGNIPEGRLLFWH
jgi:hypothetical protein